MQKNAPVLYVVNHNSLVWWCSRHSTFAMKEAKFLGVSSVVSEIAIRSTSSLIVNTMTFSESTHVRRFSKRHASKSNLISDKQLPKMKKSKEAKAEPVPYSSNANDIQEEKPWYYFFAKGDAEYNAYMATEWGFERHGDSALFEKISLEGAQAGLSWRTILKKREAYRKTFYNFDPVKVAAMTESDVEEILAAQPIDSTRDVIVRHKGKIESVINNAQCILKLREEDSTLPDSFDYYLWSFVDHKPILNRIEPGNAPSKSAESETMSKALKKRGFKFVGPTTCYSLMQAIGMVIDHPFNSPEWHLAHRRLQERTGGYQDRTDSISSDM